MENSKVSIIVPVYKAEKYLKKCVDSLRRQTYSNLEILLIDDGSPDNCGKLCDEYAKLDDRIVVIHKENGGLSDARNTGLDNITGGYIAFVDSDDYIKEDMIEVLYNNIIIEDADVSSISISMVRENGEYINGTDTKERIVYNGDEIIKQLLLHNTIKNYVCDKLYRKELFDNIRFPLGVTYEDIPTSLNILGKANKLVYEDSIKYYYVKHRDAISANCSEGNVNNYINAIISRFNLIEKEWPDIRIYNFYAIANTCIHAYYKAMLSNLPIEIYREKLDFLIEKCIYINEHATEVIELFSTYQKACFYMLLNDEELFVNFLADRQRKNKSNSAS